MGMKIAKDYVPYKGSPYAYSHLTNKLERLIIVNKANSIGKKAKKRKAKPHKISKEERELNEMFWEASIAAGKRRSYFRTMYVGAREKFDYISGLDSDLATAYNKYKQEYEKVEAEAEELHLKLQSMRCISRIERDFGLRENGVRNALERTHAGIHRHDKLIKSKELHTRIHDWLKENSK